LCEYERAFGFSQEGNGTQANRKGGKSTACELRAVPQSVSASISIQNVMIILYIFNC
jgi:hypothetical protein